MKKVYLLSVFLMSILLLASTGIFSQAKISEVLGQRLSGKNKFTDIKAIVNNYYREQLQQLSPADTLQKKILRRELKMWNRSLFDASGRLNAAGEVENSSQKIYEYLSAHQDNQLQIESSSGNWQLAGPTFVDKGVGRINRIAFDPANSLKLYAGSSGGGLFVTTNGGLFWNNISSFIPSLGISGIVVSHANSNTIYILTGDGDSQSSGGFTFSFGYIRYSVGVLKSTDGGNSWQRTAAFPGLESLRYTGLRLVQDPNAPDVLFAATSRGLFRTTNGGNSWAMCDLPGNDSTMVYDLEFRPGSSTIMYASIRFDGNDEDGRFVRSNNGGLSFTEANSYNPNSFTNVERIEIAVTPADPDRVYLLAGPGNRISNTYKGVWMSVDGGLNFNRRSNSPNILGAPDASVNDQNLYDLAIAASPTSAGTVLTGGLVVFRSTGSGTTFTQATSYFGSPNIHPDVHDLAYNPLNGNLYAATDGGVAVSTDNGINWTRLFNGLSCTQFYHFSMQDDGGDIWGGTQDNGILIKNGNASTFYEYHSGDGYDVLTDMAPAGNQDDKYYSVNEKVYADGTPDTDITPPAADNFFANLGMHSTDEDIIYAGYEQLYISYNRGSDWVTVNNVVNQRAPGNWALATCPSNSLRIYSAGDGEIKGLFRIDNIGLPVMQATNITSGLIDKGYNGSSKITDIAVHPSNSNRVWVTIGDYIDRVKVFYSNDAGANWTNISGTLPNLPANCILADGSGNVYVGTDIGVYYRGSGDTTWTPFYNNLPRVAITELEFLAIGGTNISIYASTYGRGIWFSDVFSACASTLDITSNLRGQQFFQAGSTITSTSRVDGGAGTKVFFKAGQSVTLTPGFHAESGTELQTIIGPCNTGDVPQRISFNEGDSTISVRNKIRSTNWKARITGLWENNGQLQINFRSNESGTYTLRIFDHELQVYVTSLSITISGVGRSSKDFPRPLQLIPGKKYRADLYDGDDLYSMHDF